MITAKMKKGWFTERLISKTWDQVTIMRDTRKIVLHKGKKITKELCH